MHSDAQMADRLRRQAVNEDGRSQHTRGDAATSYYERQGKLLLARDTARKKEEQLLQMFNVLDRRAALLETLALRRQARLVVSAESALTDPVSQLTARSGNRSAFSSTAKQLVSGFGVGIGQPPNPFAASARSGTTAAGKPAIQHDAKKSPRAHLPSPRVNLPPMGRPVAKGLNKLPADAHWDDEDYDPTSLSLHSMPSMMTSFADELAFQMSIDGADEPLMPRQPHLQVGWARINLHGINGDSSDGSDSSNGQTLGHITRADGPWSNKAALGTRNHDSSEDWHHEMREFTAKLPAIA